MFIDSLLVLRITVNKVYSSAQETLSSCGIIINVFSRYHISGAVFAYNTKALMYNRTPNMSAILFIDNAIMT